MTLTSYYEKLPKPTPPKTAFLRKIAERCGVDVYTVRLWVSGTTQPRDEAHRDIISEETGIPKEELFA